MTISMNEDLATGTAEFPNEQLNFDWELAEGVEGGCGGPLVVENDIAVGELGFQETEGEQLVNGEHMAVEVFETASLVIAITVVGSLLVRIWSSRCSGLRYRLFRVELCFADSVSRDAGQLRYREEKNSH